MAKRILVVVGSALGHVGRSLVIARSLKRAGYVDVCFAGASPGYAEKLIPGEFPFYPLTYKRAGDLVFARELEALIFKIKPSVICLDINPLPWLFLVRFPDIPQVFITNWFLTALGSSVTYQDEWFGVNSNEWNKFREKRGLDPVINPRHLYQRELTLLCDIPGLVPKSKTLSSHMRLVGPCFWEPDGDLPLELKTEKRFVMVAFGSSGTVQLDQRIPEGVAEVTNCDTIIWLGSDTGVRAYSESRRFRHLKYVWLPVSRLIHRAEFVITQGGAGSTYQALSRGIPVGVWPSHTNHEILGQIVEDAKVGVFSKKLNMFLNPGASEYLSLITARANKMKTDLTGPHKAARNILGLI